jgi:hypothetical protein
MRQKDLIEIGVTGVLLIVLIFVFGNTAKRLKSRNSRPKIADLISQSPKAEEKIDSRSLYNTLEQEAKSIELKRDPFTSTPIINERNMQSGFALTGILWDEVKPLAIIDGEVVKKGDKVGSKVIVDIKEDRVILSDGQEFFEVKLEL